MNAKKIALKEQQNTFNNSLSQWQFLCKQANDEISAKCEYGSEIELLMTINEVRSEKTNNKQDLVKLIKAYNERFAV